MSAERPVVQPCLVQPRRLIPVTGRSLLASARARVALVAFAVASCVAALGAALPAAALALPDGRGYEQVTPVDKNAQEVGPGIGGTDANAGNAVNWEAIGGCCGATSAASTLYQSSRTAGGWQTTAKTPTPPTPLVGLFEEQQPMWWSPDLSKTIYLTPSSYTANDARPPGPGSTVFFDLYEQDASGVLSWLTGPFPTARDTNQDNATWAATTPDGNSTLFTSKEPLTSDATPLSSANTDAEYLYDRNNTTGATTLINVDNSGALISPFGAIAGNGNFLNEPSLPANDENTTTNSISSDGTKVFFESPPTCLGGACAYVGATPTHLYMRDLSTSTTTPIDDPGSSGHGVYEGASQDGSRVFFTSTEALGGDANTNTELYEFNTNAGTITPLSNDAANTDANFVGTTAISNDGHFVWFVDKDALPGALGGTPNQGDMNFYVYDTTANTTTFIAALGSGITGDNRDKQVLTNEPDTARAAIPTPTGNVMVFESTANLDPAHPNPSGPSTTLAADVNPPGDGQPISIPVASTAGFLVGRTVEIEDSFFSESATIMGIPDSTHLLVTNGFGLFFSHSSGAGVEQRPPFEIYRYTTSNNSITCVSCSTVGGAGLTGSAGLGASGGGSYGPSGTGVPMSSDGSRIFFNSPDPLAPGVISTPPIPIGLFGGLTFAQNIYEWENGTVSAITDGHSTTGSSLGSTTPSGNDVFFTTEDQLVPQDTDGYDDIYDARVGGGFPAPATPAPACASPDACRSSVAPTQFFTAPSSTTLVESNPSAPTFTVNAISARQRKSFAKTGKLTITVHASQAGKLRAVASARIKGATEILSSASHSLSGARGGTAKLTLHLGKAARKALASKHKLTVNITVSYSESGQVEIATVNLTQKKRKKSKRATTRLRATTSWVATTRRATVRRGARER
jgi:hypothetical protein